jgi:hypothetical protein
MNTIERIEARFRSGNSVPVERAYVTADEWNGLRHFPVHFIEQVIQEVFAMAESGKSAQQIATFVEVVLSDCRPSEADIRFALKAGELT